MPPWFRHALILLPLVAACVGGDKGKDDSGLDDGATCTPYEPTAADDSQTDAWQTIDVGNGSDNEGVVYTFTAPSDPGGGVLRVVLAAAGDVIPALLIQESNDSSGAIIAGSSADTPEPHTKYASFAVQANHAYRIEVRQQFGADPDSYPQDFTLSWTFESLIDCYEPNDSAAQAVAIPLAQVIEAYAFAGYAGNSLGGVEYDDWYSVTLAQAATLQASLLSPPGDGHRMNIRIWSSDGSRQLGAGGGSAGGEIFSAEAAVEAGTYLISVEVAAASSAKTEDQTPEPPHFSQPYTLQVSAN
jgi:hypothetical protein